MTSERDTYERGWASCDLCKTRHPGRELEPAEVLSERAHGLIRVIRCRDQKWCKRERDRQKAEAHLDGAGA